VWGIKKKGKIRKWGGGVRGTEVKKRWEGRETNDRKEHLFNKNLRKEIFRGGKTRIGGDGGGRTRGVLTLPTEWEGEGKRGKTEKGEKGDRNSGKSGIVLDGVIFRGGSGNFKRGGAKRWTKGTRPGGGQEKGWVVEKKKKKRRFWGGKKDETGPSGKKKITQKNSSRNGREDLGKKGGDINGVG